MGKYKEKQENWKNWKVRKNQEIVKKWKMGKNGKIVKIGKIQENKRKWKIREKEGKIGGYLTKSDKPYEIKGQT